MYSWPTTGIPDVLAAVRARCSALCIMYGFETDVILAERVQNMASLGTRVETGHGTTRTVKSRAPSCHDGNLAARFVETETDNE